jgi:phosphatidylserine/phosphatidylglycerophosphate/cardiolipin synthase-like enzyme
MNRIIQSLVLLLIIPGCIQNPIPEENKNPNTTIHETSEFALPNPIIGLQITAQGGADSLIEVFFSDPPPDIEGEYQDGPDKHLVEAIDNARVSVDLAAYNLNLWSVRDALIRAIHRGLLVRIVMESDNIGDEIPQELKEEGIEIIGDRREGLMHNKFVIIDRQDVWTGSMNLTLGGAYFDNNNLLHLHSVDAAESYLKEFDEMFEQDMFGSDVIKDTPHSSVYIDGSQVEIYFSPDDGIADRIIELIKTANTSIYFMAYSFTANDIGNAIREKSEAGILVKGLMDENQVHSNSGTEYDPFLQAGINVITSSGTGFMHHKVIIIDQKIVITGSYNFSKNAEMYNDENIVVIHNLEIAQVYMTEFEKLTNQILP